MDFIDLTTPPRPKAMRSRTGSRLASSSAASFLDISDECSSSHKPTKSYKRSAPSPAHASSSRIADPPAKKRRRTRDLAEIGAAPSQTKRRRKDIDTSEPPQEKRLARFKASCPQNIYDRVERVMSQRFFMIERQRNGEELKEEFKVLGSTGNVYTVTIDHLPSCTCPDYLRGNHCKHILFIFLKVLQVTQDSGYWYQKALLSSELAAIFAECPAAPNSLAHARVREAYARATGKAVAESSSSASNKRIPGPDDSCPICYEDMHGVAEAKLSFCDACGNALHKECFQQWAKSAKSNLTCVWCRAPWKQPGSSNNARGKVRATGLGDEGYLNLADVAGLDSQRDESSYYRGSRRGQRYRGFQDYEDYE